MAADILTTDDLPEPMSVAEVIAQDEILQRIRREAEEDDDEAPLAIRDHADLTKVMRHRALVQSRIDENNATARMEMERIEHWRHEATEVDMRAAAWMDSLIRAYALRKRAEGIKSQTTPYGDWSSRSVPPEFIRDDAVLRPWAAENGYLHAPKEPAIDWERIKKEAVIKGERLVLPDGEIVPGVEVRPKDPAVKIEPKP